VQRCACESDRMHDFAWLSDCQISSQCFVEQRCSGLEVADDRFSIDSVFSKLFRLLYQLLSFFSSKSSSFRLDAIIIPTSSNISGLKWAFHKISKGFFFRDALVTSDQRPIRSGSYYFCTCSLPALAMMAVTPGS
jgi:hypothetical protein